MTQLQAHLEHDRGQGDSREAPERERRRQCRRRDDG
jgi:hypothetical protein